MSAASAMTAQEMKTVKKLCCERFIKQGFFQVHAAWHECQLRCMSTAHLTEWLLKLTLPFYHPDTPPLHTNVVVLH